MGSAIAGFTAVEDERKDSSRIGVGSKTRSTGTSRRETILSLVEMLLKSGDDLDDATGLNQAPAFEDDKDVPTVDEAHQTAGAEAFHKFEKRIGLLDKELRNFSNAARQLGSSAAILSSAFQLRRRLAYILFLYHENAADLFPRKISHPSPTQPSPAETAKKRRMRSAAALSARYKALPHAARPTVSEPLDLEDFPCQFELLAQDVMTLLRCLNEFPEFTDEAVNASITSFNGDLKYWSSCLKVYTGQFRYPAVQRYIQDLAAEMGDHIDNITATLSMFIEVGVPTIRFAQKHGATNLLNLSTVATFFSAVTATTLQFSFEIETPVGAAVNAFWFLSLVFSIGAAVNSLLGLTWKQAIRSPGHRVPWWVLIWIKRSPLVFLVLSVMCFSIGLCVFAYASEQHHVVSTITTVFTAFTSFGLVAVSMWFASERWTFLRHQGQKWLGDVLIETNEKILNMRGIGTTRKMMHWFFGRLVSIAQRLHLVKMNLHIDSSSDGSKSEDLEAANGSGMISEDAARPMSPVGVKIPRASDVGSQPMASIMENVVPGSPSVPSPIATESSTRIGSPPGSPIPTNLPSPTTPGKQLWRNAIRAVAMRSQVSSNLEMINKGNLPRAPHRQRTASSSGSREQRRRAEEPVKVVLMRSRVSALSPQLKCLEPTQDLAAHQALVRHLQFSPDGKFLATSSWDRTSVIFRVGEKPGEFLSSHRILAHAKGFVSQVAWSPSGDLLLTKLGRGVKVWTRVCLLYRAGGAPMRFVIKRGLQDGVCQRTIDRPTAVESITWFPGGEAFLSVEGSSVTKLDLKGKVRKDPKFNLIRHVPNVLQVLGTYHFGSIRLHDVAVTPDCVRLLGVGPLLESPDKLKPSKSRVEKRLLVYNMETEQIENTTPVLNDVRDITLAKNTRNGLVALVSYEHKAPPQLWKMDLVRDRENTEKLVARLTLRHTYMPKLSVDFAGPSYFGGKNDELVLCAGKGEDSPFVLEDTFSEGTQLLAGDIHIWDQESGSLLHHVKSSALGGDLTCIAWNHAAENPFMFATGSHDGAVRIWTKPTSDSPSLENITNQPRSYSPNDMSERTHDSYASTPRNRSDNLQSGLGNPGGVDDSVPTEPRTELPDPPLPRDRTVDTSSDATQPQQQEQLPVSDREESKASSSQAQEIIGESSKERLHEVVPSIVNVERTCLMALNNLLSGPSSWKTIVPDRRHSMPSSPQSSSAPLVEFDSSSSALQTLVSNLRSKASHGAMIQTPSSQNDTELIHELRTRVEDISLTLDSSDAELIRTLISLLSHLNRLSLIINTSPSSRNPMVHSQSFNALHAATPDNLFDTLKRQLSDFQVERLTSQQEDFLPSGSKPVVAVEAALLWSRIDEELETVVNMCRERTEQLPRFHADHLPPQYDPAEYDEKLPDYDDETRVSLDEKSRTTTAHSPVIPAGQLSEKRRLDLEAVTMAIDRLYLVAPQLHNQRVELKTSKLEQMEKARREGQQSLKARGKQKQQGDIRELEKMLELISKASDRTFKDQSREAFVEALAEHSSAGRLHNQDAILGPKTKDPNALLTLPEFIREAVPPDAQRLQDPRALLTLPEFVKEVPPPHIMAKINSPTAPPTPSTFARLKKKTRDRSISAPPLAWLRSSSSRSNLNEAKVTNSTLVAKSSTTFEVGYLAEHHETLQHILVFFTVSGAQAGVDVEAEVLPSFTESFSDEGDRLIIKSGANTSLPLPLPARVSPGRKEVKVQSGHYEIKLPTLPSIGTISPPDQRPLLDATQLSHDKPTSFICASCSLPIIQSSKVQDYRDLPSEHWEELVDAWMCHSAQKVHDDVIKHSRNGFWPEPGQALVGGSYILFEESAMTQDNISTPETTKKDDDHRVVRCLCGAIVGRCQERQSGQEKMNVYRVLKYSVRPVSPTAEPVKIPLSAFIVEDMTEFVHAHASYRFVLSDEEDERPRILIWLFKPNMQIGYAAQRPYAIPRSASMSVAKVLFKLLGPSEGRLDLKTVLDKYPGFPQAEYLFYPMDTCQRLAVLLKESNRTYPEDMRTMTGLDVGWLQRG
ncbi:hypothetical protein VNI00_006655 [Paramarasmius palmivorus]|uniref:Uncharacterized protein n=1 Tax=Paramarasmius palmivorus TaxID=297713 RepID=A0AAW0D7J4_9AGAR